MSGGLGQADEEARLEELRRRYPRWLIWRGTKTSDYWAMPPREHPAAQALISAPTVEELAGQLAVAEQQPGS